MEHKPALLNEAINFLSPHDGAAFIDATIDGGGHAREILKKMPKDAILVGIDRDKSMILRLQKEFAFESRLKLKAGNFMALASLAGGEARGYDGILFDLGLSSIQLESSGRGFSFQKDEPLLMTYESEPSVEATAAKLVNSLSEKELAEILKKYGEERFANRIAKAVANERKRRKILTTSHLIRVIQSALPRFLRHSKIHPATRTFQALRIAVNDELRALSEGLRQAWEILADGGRLVVISFHSLEDRIVKNFFSEKRREEKGEILTKKPLRPSKAELAQNPRVRSARLRAIIKIK